MRRLYFIIILVVFMCTPVFAERSYKEITPLYVSNIKLCSEISAFINGDEFIKARIGKDDPEYVAGAFRRFAADLDNDNEVETVYAYQATTHYRIGTTYFAFDKPDDQIEELISKASPMEWEELAEELAKSAKVIYPYSWSTDKRYIRDLGNGQLKSRAMIQANIQGSFEFRYLGLMPFSYQGSIYFLFSSAEENKSNVLGVAQVENDTGVHEICYFKVVPIDI